MGFSFHKLSLVFSKCLYKFKIVNYAHKLCKHSAYLFNHLTCNNYVVFAQWVMTSK